MAGERAFGFLRINEREGKPRRRGVTEIRGPYYTALGKRYLEDVLETMGAYVDALKYAGGSFTLMPREVVRELNELCHRHQVEVSTGGFLEYVLTQGPDAIDRSPPNAGSSASTWSRSRAASSRCRSTTSSR
jgi:phosphosulfolactate synthase (CoM biosynthesis protein A)